MKKIILSSILTFSFLFVFAGQRDATVLSVDQNGHTGTVKDNQTGSVFNFVSPVTISVVPGQSVTIEVNLPDAAESEIAKKVTAIIVD